MQGMRLRAPALSLLVAFTVVDLVFRPLVVISFLVLIGAHRPVHVASVLATVAVWSPLFTCAFLASIALFARPVSQFRRKTDPTDRGIMRAVTTLHALPSRLTLLC